MDGGDLSDGGDLWGDLSFGKSYVRQGKKTTSGAEENDLWGNLSTGGDKLPQRSHSAEVT
jgi:hypothetical protein